MDNATRFQEIRNRATSVRHENAKRYTCVTVFDMTGRVLAHRLEVLKRGQVVSTTYTFFEKGN